VEILNVKTSSRTDFREITGEVASFVSGTGIREGICVVFVPHTTAGVTLNENADPAARQDVAATLDRLVPWEGPYRHAEGNSAAHVKASMVGSSATVPISRGALLLGTWQGIYLCEFDGPRSRRVYVNVVKAT
jgi:secondary thiamine-phosphate synthase enzyme